MINGKIICGQFMKMSQSDYSWLDSEKALINKVLLSDVCDGVNVIMPCGHKLSARDISNARESGYLIDIIIAVKK